MPKGVYIRTEETKNKIRLNRKISVPKGSHRSQEIKERIRNTIIKRIREGKINPFKKGYIPWNKNKGGYKFKSYQKDRKTHIVSDITKQKISKANKGKKRSKEFCKKQSERFKREKSLFWQGGKSFEKYTLEWNKWLKQQIRERDNYTCQLCGKKENKRKHSIHHIDYNKKNCNINNLITICVICHSKTNKNRRFWQNVFTQRRI